jgi:hypothetical protein
MVSRRVYLIERPRLRLRLRGKKTPRHDWSLLNLSLNLSLWYDSALHEHRRPSSLPSLPLDDKFVLIPMHNIA